MLKGFKTHGLSCTVVVGIFTIILFFYPKPLSLIQQQWVFRFFFFKFLRKGDLNSETEATNEKQLCGTSCTNYFKKVCILFGTQSGTAERISKQFCHLLRQKISCVSTLINLGELEFSQFTESDSNCLWIFCIATYGDGDPVDSARAFYKNLHKLPKQSNRLYHISYTILGLGNSEYERFNWAAKLLDKQLQKLKAHRICAMGIADEKSNTERDALVWFENILVPSLKNRLSPEHFTPLQLDSTNSIPILQSPHSSFNSMSPFHENEAFIHSSRFVSPTFLQQGINNTCQFKSIAGPLEFYFTCFSCPLIQSDELLLCPSRAKTLSVKHLTFDLSYASHVTDSNGNFRHPNFKQPYKLNLIYEPGNSLQILTPNKEEEVQWWSQVLCSGSFSSDWLLCFDEKDSGVHVPFPNGVSLENILRYFSDLQGCVSRDFLSKLLWFMEDANERFYLEKLISMDAQKDYEELMVNSMINIREAVCLLCTSARFFKDPSELDIITLLFMLPRKMPRAYSISSAANQDQYLLSLTVKVIAHPTSPETHSNLLSLHELENKIKQSCIQNIAHCPLVCSRKTFSQPRKFLGCVSGAFYSQLPPSYPTLMRFMTPSFSVKWSQQGPIVLIAAGTGIAPCRSIWRHLDFLDQKNNEEFHADCTLSLIYGCTHPDVDFLYRNEIQQVWGLDSNLSCYTRRRRFPHAFFAFSRIENNQYVQDVLQNQAKTLVMDCSRHPLGLIYVCGSVPMGREVSNKLSQMISKKKLKQMKRRHAYLEELCYDGFDMARRTSL